MTDIRPAYPRHVSLGEDYHAVQEKLSRHRKFKKLGLISTKLSSGNTSKMKI